jgi:hypothetical protein
MTPFPMDDSGKMVCQDSDRTMNFFARGVDNIEFLGTKTYQTASRWPSRGTPRHSPSAGSHIFAPTSGEVATTITIGEIRLQYVLNNYKL